MFSKITALYPYTKTGEKIVYWENGERKEKDEIRIIEEVFILDITGKNAIILRKTYNEEICENVATVEEVPLSDLIITDKNVLPAGIIKSTKGKISTF